MSKKQEEVKEIQFQLKLGHQCAKNTLSFNQHHITDIIAFISNFNEETKPQGDQETLPKA